MAISPISFATAAAPALPGSGLAGSGLAAVARKDPAKITAQDIAGLSAEELEQLGAFLQGKIQNEKNPARLGALQGVQQMVGQAMAQAMGQMAQMQNLMAQSPMGSGSMGRGPMGQSPVAPQSEAMNRALGGDPQSRRAPQFEDQQQARANPGGAEAFPGAGNANGATLAQIRERFGAELKNPAVRERLLQLTESEVGGQGPDVAKTFVESTMNRASSRGKSLMATMNDPNYFPNSSLGQRAVSPGTRAMYASAIDQALGGSNVALLATGNESGNVTSGRARHGADWAPITRNFGPGRERFVVENPDKSWAASVGVG